MAFGIDSIDGTWVSLEALGRDDKLDLHVGDWVEISDDAAVLAGSPEPLLHVEEVDVPGRRVRLSEEPTGNRGRVAAHHPILRRWDPRQGALDLDGGALVIKEGRWISLEDGVQVWFGAKGEYRAGDYWLIPARTLTGDVEWGRDAAGRPLLSPPEGIRYHYAPLAWITEGGKVTDLRHVFPALTRTPGAAQEGAGTGTPTQETSPDTPGPAVFEHADAEQDADDITGEAT